MQRKSHQPFDNARKHLDTNTESVGGFCYYPMLNKCRDHGNFISDNHRRESICSKRYQGHPTLLPGIFTVFCPHGKPDVIYILNQFQLLLIDLQVCAMGLRWCHPMNLQMCHSRSWEHGSREASFPVYIGIVSESGDGVQWCIIVVMIKVLMVLNCNQNRSTEPHFHFAYLIKNPTMKRSDSSLHF